MTIQNKASTISKNITSGLIILISVVFIATLAFLPFSAKTSAKVAPTQNVTWNIASAVMPGAPYGAGDRPGSQITSRLSVDGKKLTISGVMNGLLPNQVHSVLLAGSYVPFTPEKVIGGPWFINDTAFTNDSDWYTSSKYWIDAFAGPQNTDGTFSGHYCYPSGTCDIEAAMTYQLVGNQLTISTTLAPFNDPILGGYTLPTTGTVQPDGSVRSNDPNFPWFIGSSAVQNGYPGLFTTSIQPVQAPILFKTNRKGSGSWTINLDRKDLLAGPNAMSIWIKNGDDTRMGVYGGDLVLISDNFTLTK